MEKHKSRWRTFFEASVTVFFLAALVFSCSSSAQEPTQEGKQVPASRASLRIVSYNIKHGRGMDGKVDLSRTAEVLRGLKPDVVGLQEVDYRATRSGAVDEPAELGRMLEMAPAFGSFMDFQGGKYGLAILSRHPIIRSRVIELPVGNEPRVALAAEIRLPSGISVMVVNVHFDWVRDDKFRYAQASRLGKYLDGLTVPYVLLGDFNDGPESRTVKLFKDRAREAEKPSAIRFTFSSTNPSREIDFIFAAPRSDWEFDSTGVHDEQVASDHRPVFTEARYRKLEADYPGQKWPEADPEDVDLDNKLLQKAKEYSLTAGGAGLIVRNGKAVMRWGDQRRRYDIKSATKSFGATMLGIAIKDGKVELSDLVTAHHPTFAVPPKSNAAKDWQKQITLFNLATQTAGFDKGGGYEKLLFEPGSHWHYSDGGPNWLAECLTLKYGRDLHEIMLERLFSPLGISRDDLQWRKNQYRDQDIEGIVRREFGAGIYANVEAMSRLGYLYLRNGRWKDKQIISAEFVRTATMPLESVIGKREWSANDSHGNASDHYGLLWWNNADGTLRKVMRFGLGACMTA